MHAFSSQNICEVIKGYEKSLTRAENTIMFSASDQIQSRFTDWKMADDCARMRAEEEEAETPARKQINQMFF